MPLYLSTATPPLGLPVAELPIGYFLQLLDTPLCLWAIRLLLVLGAAAMVAGCIFYLYRARHAEEQGGEDIE